MAAISGCGRGLRLKRGCDIMGDNHTYKEGEYGMEQKNVLQFIKENFDQLTGSQKTLGKYVLDNYRKVAFMSAIELGEQVGVSDATAIRFAQAIGFKGYAEFRNSIRESLKNIDLPHNRIPQNSASLTGELNQLSQVGKTDLKNLEDFLLNLDMGKIAEGVEAIYKARAIYLMGMRLSGTIIDFLALHLRRMGFKVIQITQGGLANFEKIMDITENDLLITFSFPRYSKPTYNVILLAKEKGAKVLTITDTNTSSISIKSDIIFLVYIENDFTFFNSHVVTLELCHILLMSILEKDKERISKSLQENMQRMDVFDMDLYKGF
ncbi:MAG: MurR/RpiR family transcriptional regulator [Peptococcaceae bacterium]